MAKPPAPSAITAATAMMMMLRFFMVPIPRSIPTMRASDHERRRA
jgi:hypothetical protein